MAISAYEAITTFVWIAVTFLTKPESRDVLLSFYRKVRPHAAGWQPIAQLAPDVPQTRDLAHNLRNWLLGCLMVYSALFGVGKICFQQFGTGALLLAIAAACAAGIYFDITRRGWGDVSSSG